MSSNCQNRRRALQHFYRPTENIVKVHTFLVVWNNLYFSCMELCKQEIWYWNIMLMRRWKRCLMKPTSKNVRLSKRLDFISNVSYCSLCPSYSRREVQYVSNATLLLRLSLGGGKTYHTFWRWKFYILLCGNIQWNSLICYNCSIHVKITRQMQWIDTQNKIFKELYISNVCVYPYIRTSTPHSQGTVK